MSKKSIIYAVIAVIAVLAIFLTVKFISYSKNAPLGAAKLSWNANIEPNIGGYNIYYGTEPRIGACPKGGYPDKIDAGKNTAFTLEKLQNSKTYYFSTTSYNTSGKESCFSAEVKKEIRMSKWEIFKKLIDNLL